MAVIHNARTGLGAVNYTDDAAPLIAEHLVVAKLLKLSHEDIGNVLFFTRERGAADYALRKVEHICLVRGCEFFNAVIHS